MGNQMHANATDTVQCKLPGCDVVFKPTKPWQAFCTPEHRNKFHHAKATIPQMLRRIERLEAIVDELERKVGILLPDLN